MGSINKILTIGIPTYNREKYIVEQVRRLLPQLTDKVKLVVVDNCSSYDIYSSFSEEEKSQFDIKRNRCNIGGDANIANIIYNSDTKWVWVLGDDDYVMDNAVQTVLHYLEKYPEELYINFNATIEAESHDFSSFVDLFKYRLVFGYSFWISSCLYNREKLSASLQYYFKYLSSQIGQIVFILKHLENQNDKCLFTKTATIDIHGVIRKETGVFSWNSADYVVNSSMLYYIFRDKKKQLRKNMFKAKSSEDFTLLYNFNAPLYKKWFYYKKIFQNMGFVAFIRCNYMTILHRWAKSLFPEILYKKIVSRLSKFAEKNW